jgi:predicted chitinase
MPYTPSVTAYLAHLEHEMAYFHVIDPAINASAGTVQATSADHAKDIVVAKMGWGSYADYVKAAANHNGTRTLKAVELKVRA